MAIADYGGAVLPYGTKPPIGAYNYTIAPKPEAAAPKVKYVAPTDVYKDKQTFEQKVLAGTKFGDLTLDGSEFFAEALTTPLSEGQTYDVTKGYPQKSTGLILSIGGQSYTFYPNNILTQGYKTDTHQFYNPKILKNLDKIGEEGQAISLEGVGWYEDYLKKNDLSTDGILLPSGNTNFNATFNSLLGNVKTFELGTTKDGLSTWGGIEGIGKVGDQYVYSVDAKPAGGASSAYGYIDPTNKIVGEAFTPGKKKGGLLGSLSREIAKVPLLPEIAGAFTGSPMVYASLKGLQGGATGQDPLKVGLQVGATVAAPTIAKNVLPADIASIPGAVSGVSGTVGGLLSGQSVEEALKTGLASGAGGAVGSQVSGAVGPTLGSDLGKAAGSIAGGTAAGLLGGKSATEALIGSTIGAGANLAGTTAGNLVNRNLFGNTPQTGAGTMDDFSNGGIQLFDDGSSIFFDNSGNVVGGIDNTGSQFNAPNFDLQIFDDGTFIARDAQGNFSFSTTDAPLFTGNAVVGTIGNGLASNAPSSLVQNLTAKAASSAASSATRSLLSRLLGGASSALNQALGTGTTEASLGALLGGLLNRGIDYATAEKIANQVRQEGQAIQQAATTAGAEAAVPFTPYTVSSGLGTTTVGPTGATTALAPEYGDIRTQALGQAAQTLGAINPAQASQTLFGQLEGLQAPARQREQEQLLSRLGASGLLGIGRNLPTVGGGIAGVNPYLESLLSAQGTQQAQNALAATQFGTQEAQRQQQLSQSLLGMGTGLDTLGTQQLSQTGALGQLPLSAQQLNAQRQLEATLTGLRSGVPFSTTAANIQAGQTGLLGQTAQDLVKEIFG
jgi:hypothetical protein